jgi:hypothetical protein
MLDRFSEMLDTICWIGFAPEKILPYDVNTPSPSDGDGTRSSFANTLKKHTLWNGSKTVLVHRLGNRERSDASGHTHVYVRHRLAL